MRYYRQPLPSRLVIRRQTRSPSITIARAYGRTYGVWGVNWYGKQGLLSACGSHGQFGKSSRCVFVRTHGWNASVNGIKE